METMREQWTDARLDDFREETARRFDSLERRVEDGFARVDARFDALQRTLLQIGGGVIATLVAGFFGVILAQL
jgi:broad specificity phosphatase PhoE